MFNGKTILITGGTGSFGQKFVEFLLSNFKMKKIIVYSRDEFKQFEMAKIYNHKSMRYFIGDVRDRHRLKLALTGVDYVVHAAALKQVISSEYNPTECIKTNIYGAENLIYACLETNVKYLVALSSDKAVNPINLYGATKLASDKLFIAANNYSAGKCIFSVTRYGNVIGSRGSVVEIYRELIKSNIDQFPITDFKMTRFWMTLLQGVEFVAKSFYRMKGGEIFIPKIPSIFIKDLIKSFNSKCKYKVIGIRPGEKLEETLCAKEDSTNTYDFGDHYEVLSSISYNRVNKPVNRLKEIGKKVSSDFEYTSSNNKDFLSIDKIKKLNLIK
jgi:UDP-N-acetylglucosamine 4,6-dehydratase